MTYCITCHAKLEGLEAHLHNARGCLGYRTDMTDDLRALRRESRQARLERLADWSASHG